MRQLALALNAFAGRKNAFPAAGTFFEDRTAPPTSRLPARSSRRPRATWRPTSRVHPQTVSASTITYAGYELGRRHPRRPRPDDLANAWSSRQIISNSRRTPRHDSLLRPTARSATPRWPFCDARTTTTTTANEGNLSYVVNGGFTAFPANIHSSGRASRPTADAERRSAASRQTISTGLAQRPPIVQHRIGQKTGVMFLNSFYEPTYRQPPIAQANSGRPMGTAQDQPERITDGTSATLLLGESTLAGYCSRARHLLGSVPDELGLPAARTSACSSRLTTSARRHTRAGADRQLRSTNFRPRTYSTA